jgi:hypothetical protein
MDGMKRLAGLVSFLLLPVLALACGGDDSKPSAASLAGTATADSVGFTPGPASTVSPRPTATSTTAALTAAPTPPAATATQSTPPALPGAASVWDTRAVWDVSKAPDDLWRTVCNAQSPVLVRENDPCIVTVMQRAGAEQQAIDFYKQNGYFIRVFMEKGRIDYARGSAPWINMGRDTQVLFLNGQPPLQELSSLTAVAQSASDWKKDPRYAEILKSEPNAFPWAEYGDLTSSSTAADGSQKFQLSIPMMMCRACPNVAQLILDLEFDNTGHFKMASLGAPQAPKQR